MEIVIDWSVLEEFGAQSFLVTFWRLFISGGWVVFVLFALWAGWKSWVKYIQKQYKAKQNYVLLAIDVPKGNEQSPLAVENIFSHLAGVHGKPNWAKKYIEGETQEGFSLEVVSLEGYIQFVIRTNVKFRDLLEAAIYAQYPDAEIYEVPDYITPFAQLRFPNNEYDLYGTEFIITAPECYPIRTHPAFEHSLSQELKDPMAAFLENFSRLGKGEYLWFQIIITPVSQKDWRAEGKKTVNKLIGAKIESKRTMSDKISDLPIDFLAWFGDLFLIGEPLTEKRAEKVKEDPPSKMLYLSPGDKKIVEAIEEKMSKIGFKTKIRMIYLAKKEVFQKPHGPNAVVGAIKQFNTVDANSFKPELKRVGTTAHYYFVDQRKNWKRNKILRAYVARSNWKGCGPREGLWGNWAEHGTGAGYILNIEELATIYHFPVTTVVKAPSVKKTESKRAEPPFGLPIVEEIREIGKGKPTQKEEPPEELPVME